MLEFFGAEALQTQSSDPFKGNMDLSRVKAAIQKYGAEKIAYIRMEASTNLLGGQPFSLANLRDVKEIASAHNIPLVYDGSLIAENAYMIKQREPAYADKSIGEIIREMMSYVDIFYMSARKCASVRGGLIATNSDDVYNRLLAWLPVYEGFATYGGMSTKEVEAMAVGLREMLDVDVAGSGVEFVKYFVERLQDAGVPVVTPAGASPRTWTPSVLCRTSRRRSTRRARWPRRSISRPACAAWSAARCRPIAIRQATRCWPTSSWCAWPCRGASIPSRTWSMPRTGWAGCTKPGADQGPEVHQRAAGAAFFFGRLAPLDGWGAQLAEAFKAEFGAAM